MPTEHLRPIVCYVTSRKSLAGAEPARALRERIRMAIAAGADWVQIREKDMPGRELQALVRDAVDLAQPATGDAAGPRVRIFVNDRLDVALAAGAAGVHLGGASLPVREVSDWRGNGGAPADFWIGASCHSLAEARQAEEHGADYIFFGPVFESPEKAQFGPPQGLEKLREVCRSVGKIRVIAIGGVNAENARACLGAGAAGIAAIRMFQEAREEKELLETVKRLHSF